MRGLRERCGSFPPVVKTGFAVRLPRSCFQLLKVWKHYRPVPILTQSHRYRADLIERADLTVPMERVHYRRLQERFGRQLKNKRISVLRIRGDYDYMDPALIRILREKVTPLLKLQAPSL